MCSSFRLLQDHFSLLYHLNCRKSTVEGTFLGEYLHFGLRTRFSPAFCKNRPADTDNWHGIHAVKNSPPKEKWAGLDSNQRRLAPTGLQPVPFSHSGTDPCPPCGRECQSSNLEFRNNIRIFECSNDSVSDF